MHDVIIVGAGPSGSTAARECAALGMRALLLDRAEFPRDKPCGGGVTVRASGLVPFDIGPVVEQVTTDVHLSFRQSSGFTRASDLDLVYMTRRRDFDSLLLEEARRAGAAVREGATVRAVERGDASVTVRAGAETFEARALVAADGANGPTARLAGIPQRHWRQIAIEGNVSPKRAMPERWSRTFGLDIGEMPGGYGWIFPKGDHLNIGVGGWKHAGPTLRSRLSRLSRHYGFDAADLWGTRGHYLNIRRANSPLADGNALVAGDAAGLIDPMTDEGIYSAMWSGGAAARHTAMYVDGQVSDLSGYAREVESALVPDLRVSRRFHDIFHLTPRLYIGIERLTSVFWGLARRILRGDQTYVNVMLDHPNAATLIDFISDLVRVTPMLQRKSGMGEPAPPQRFFVRETGQAELHSPRG